MAQIKRTPRAKQDAIDIWSYIAADNEAAADRVIAEIDLRLKSLSRMPLSGKGMPFIAHDVRCSPVKRHVIYYRPIDDGIEVLRILHERQRHNRIVE
jgi:toxin ParE1/3/4